MSTQSGGTAAPQAGRRVLLVEDESVIGNLFRNVVLDEFPGVETQLVRGGRDAIASFRTFRPDIIVMDLRMPEMDGRQAFLEIRKICKQEKWDEPRVIFCTGFSPPASMDEYIGKGGHCLLKKPVKRETLVTAITEQIQQLPPRTST
jgi:CheY-like chemotaxis protein